MTTSDHVNTIIALPDMGLAFVYNDVDRTVTITRELHRESLTLDPDRIEAIHMALDYVRRHHEDSVTSQASAEFPPMAFPQEH